MSRSKDDGKEGVVRIHPQAALPPLSISRCSSPASLPCAMNPVISTSPESAHNRRLRFKVGQHSYVVSGQFGFWAKVVVVPR
ncbi:hypothetical protein Y032_0010g1178 [Ancylostoma ceylanicum]|uniref:Uncharacterized protein n=1 Tax=Ancylostoma ceylanicum TaxID=53326 RepID=A0A016VI88_9BILA|nr:hypothetical protein Y032_0010g1178 [Ancylostoma ceylanicum]